MRRTILLLSGVLLSVVALGSDSPKEYDGKTEYVGIEGTWRLTKLETDGEVDLPYQSVISFHTGTWVLNNGDGNWFKGTYCTDSTQKPAHLDLNTTQSNWVPLGIKKYLYQVGGDTLRIAGYKVLVDRPESLTDKSLTVRTFKRVK